jgi:methylglutamate dehydrogenase subunit D
VADVTVSVCSGIAVASIMARRGTNAEMIGAALGVIPPDHAGWQGSPALMLLGNGPGSWLAFAEPAPGDWMPMLRTRLDGLASVADQSGAYAILRLTGGDSRRLLQRGLAIDLHHSKFGPGDAAVTQLAHIGVIVWQVDASPTFDIAIPRSFAKSFHRWLNHDIRCMSD